MIIQAFIYVTYVEYIWFTNRVEWQGLIDKMGTIDRNLSSWVCILSIMKPPTDVVDGRYSWRLLDWYIHFDWGKLLTYTYVNISGIKYNIKENVKSQIRTF